MFSTLDLISSYWLVELDSKYKEKTSFCSPDVLFAFNVMPFGLCNAPVTFEGLMHMVLVGMNWKTCLVYLGNIILGRDFPTHQNMDQIFSCLRQVGLKLHPSKCRLCQQAVSFLRHKVSPAGIATAPEKKTEQMANWPTPLSRKDVKQFLGLTNYYCRFIKTYAHVALLLKHLTEKIATFKWTECQWAFVLKHKLTSTPILAHPNYFLPFTLDTNTSDVGIGAVLSQTHPYGSGGNGLPQSGTHQV